MKLSIFSQNARKRTSGETTVSRPPEEGPLGLLSHRPVPDSLPEDKLMEKVIPETGLPGPRPPASGSTPPPRMDDSRPMERQMSLADLQLAVVNRIYQIGAIVGGLAVLGNLPGIIQNARWGILALYVVIFIVVITFAIRRDFSYTVRSITVIAALFALGVVILLDEGLYGSGRVFLLGNVIVAAILSGRRSRNLALAGGLITLLLIGSAMVIGIIPPPSLEPGAGNSSLTSWITGFLGFSLVALVGVLSIGTILEGLERSVEGQKRLTNELQRERASLEERVSVRTEHLERRLVQIRTASEITRWISQVLDINVLLPQVCDLVQERFGLYYVGIFLVEENITGQENYARLAAGTGEAGRRMLENKHRLLIGGDSMIGSAIAGRKPRIALDVGQEAVRFSNPFLPRTRSELALPILTGRSSQARDYRSGSRSDKRPVEITGQVISTGDGGESERALGAITIQSEAEAAFDEDDILVLQLLADALASAIENARLLATTQESLEEVRNVHRTYLDSAWSQVRQARGELSYTYQSDSQISSGALDDTENEPPVFSTGDDANRLETAIRLRDQVIGHLVLEGVPTTEWSSDQRALVETVANQAALALENARLLEQTRSLAEQERATSNLTAKVWGSTNIDNVLRNLLGELGATLNASEGWIELWPGGEQPVRSTGLGKSGSNAEAGHVDD